MTLRWLAPADAGRLVEFFASHSEETLHQRYNSAGVRMSPEQATRLVGVDQSRDAALGVFEERGDESRLIAVGRYCLAPGGAWAEIAFVVHEERRGRGLATTLLAALMAIARERGLARLIATVRHDNGPMIHVLRGAGASFRWSAGASSMTATIDLDTGRAAPGGRTTDEPLWPKHAQQAAAKKRTIPATMQPP